MASIQKAQPTVTQKFNAVKVTNHKGFGFGTLNKNGSLQTNPNQAAANTSNANPTTLHGTKAQQNQQMLGRIGAMPRTASPKRKNGAQFGYGFKSG